MDALRRAVARIPASGASVFGGGDDFPRADVGVRAAAFDNIAALNAFGTPMFDSGIKGSGSFSRISGISDAIAHPSSVAPSTSHSDTLAIIVPIAVAASTSLG